MRLIEIANCIKAGLKTYSFIGENIKRRMSLNEVGKQVIL